MATPQAVSPLSCHMPLGQGPKDNRGQDRSCFLARPGEVKRGPPSLAGAPAIYPEAGQTTGLNRWGPAGHEGEEAEEVPSFLGGRRSSSGRLRIDHRHGGKPARVISEKAVEEIFVGTFDPVPSIRVCNCTA